MDWSSLWKQQLRVAARPILELAIEKQLDDPDKDFFDLWDIPGNRFGLQPVATRRILEIVCLNFSRILSNASIGVIRQRRNDCVDQQLFEGSIVEDMPDRFPEYSCRFHRDASDTVTLTLIKRGK